MAGSDGGEGEEDQVFRVIMKAKGSRREGPYLVRALARRRRSRKRKARRACTFESFRARAGAKEMMIRSKLGRSS